MKISINVPCYILALCSVWSCQAFAQFGQVESCLVIHPCSCPDVEGRVNPCTGDWTLKNKNNVVTVEVNNDPLACNSSVQSNLRRLETYFGDRPEIGLPTKEMTSIVDTIEIPEAPFISGLKTLSIIDSVEENASIDSKIQAEIVRISSLTENMHTILNTKEILESWEKSAVAATTLNRKVEGMAKALSLANSWPSVNEFAPLIWELRVCGRLQTAEIALLKAHLSDENNLAWSFAFYPEWSDFVKPFTVPTFDAKMRAFESIASPFYAQQLTTVKIRSDKTLQTSLEIRSFKQSLERKILLLNGYISGVRNEIQIRRTEINDELKIESGVVAELKASLKEMIDSMLPIKADLSKKEQDKKKVLVDIGNTNTTIRTIANSITAAIAKRDKLESSILAAETDVNRKRDTVTKTQEALEKIAINCGGLSYENCTDVNAVQEYDRLKYEANVKISSARAEYNSSLKQLTTLNEQLPTVEREIIDQQLAQANKNKDLGLLVALSKSLDKSILEFSETVTAMENKVSPAIKLMAELDRSVVALEELLKL